MPDLRSIVGDYETFLSQILKETEDAGFALSDFSQMDHMCYRVSSREAYEVKKEELKSVGRLLGENQINGRPISTFRLNEPVRHGNWRIDAVELPAPKPGRETKEGLEHVELVLFDDMQDFLRKHSDKSFAMQAADRGVNPEVGFKLPNYTVKFHLLSLPTVVYLENKLGMTDIRDGQ